MVRLLKDRSKLKETLFFVHHFAISINKTLCVLKILYCHLLLSSNDPYDSNKHTHSLNLENTEPAKFEN